MAISIEILFHFEIQLTILFSHHVGCINHQWCLGNTFSVYISGMWNTFIKKDEYIQKSCVENLPSGN